MMKRQIFILTLLIAVAATVFSQTRWEGTAAAARYGEFPPGGYYAASSAFPRNAIVELTNAATGQAVQVIVVRRSEDPGILMLLSQEAASALGVSPGSPVQVEARGVTQPNLTAVNPNEDLPFHPDPDINPAASVGDPNESLLDPQAAPEESATAAVDEAMADERMAESPAAEVPVEEDPEAPREPAREEPSETARRADEIEPDATERPPDLAERPQEPVAAAETDRDVPIPDEPGRVADVEERDEPEAPPRRSVIPVPQRVPETEAAPPSAEREAPEPVESAPRRDLIPVPERRPPVGEIVEEPMPAEEPVVEAEPEPPVRDVVPVPSRRPPQREEPAVDIVREPEPDAGRARQRLGVASGVTRTAGGLAVREIERPETAFRRPEVRDTGADVRVARPAAPSPPAPPQVEEEIVAEPAVPEIVASPENPLDQAIAAVIGRMPREELFPPPRAGTVATLLRRPEAPSEAAVTDGRLAEARMPREESPVVEAEPEVPSEPREELADGPTVPDDPTRAELRPPAPPQGPVRGRLADARARIESPDIVERKEPPVDGVEGALAEAEPGDREIANGPQAVDRPPSPDDEVEGRLEQPRDGEGPAVAERIGEPEELVEGRLPLAEVRTPETSVAAPDPPEEELDVAAASPRVGEGAEIVRDDLDAGGLVPDDAILALEPADFRPPPIPEAEPGLDRLSPTEDAVIADGPEPSAEGLPDDRGPDEIVDRPTPGAEAIADAGREPGLPETPDALARPDAETTDVDGEAPVPGAPPRPEQLARPGAGEEPVIADAREPSPPVEAPRPEGVPRVGREEQEVAAEEPPPREPGPPEPGMRAETDAEGPPRVAGTDRPAPPAETGEPAMPTAERAEAEVARPRDVAPSAEPVRADEWASKNLPLVGKLSTGAYYLQVGAYSSPRSAKSAIDVLDRDYPVAVLPTESDDRTVYRLFVGPLNEDERGTMLYWFRARGYKDAFIRKGD